MRNRIVISMMVLAMAGATLTGCGGAEAEVATEVSTEGGTEEEIPDFSSEAFAEDMDTSGYLYDMVVSEGLTGSEASEVLFAALDAGGYIKMYEDDDDKEPCYFDADGELICTDSYAAYLAALEAEEHTASAVDIWEGKDDISFTEAGLAYVCLADMSDSEAQDLVSVYESEVSSDAVCVIAPEGNVLVTGVDDYEAVVNECIEMYSTEAVSVEPEVAYDYMCMGSIEADEAYALIEASGLVPAEGELYLIDAENNVTMGTEEDFFALME